MLYRRERVEGLKEKHCLVAPEIWGFQWSTVQHAIVPLQEAELDSKRKVVEFFFLSLHLFRLFLPETQSSSFPPVEGME